MVCLNIQDQYFKNGGLPKTILNFVIEYLRRSKKSAKPKKGQKYRDTVSLNEQLLEIVPS